MKAEIVGALAANSFQAMLKVFIICFVGFMCARYPVDKPLLSKPALQYISKMSTFIFIPCLSMSSLGSSLSFSLFSRIGFLLLCCPATTLVSHIISEVVNRFLLGSEVDISMSTVVSVACCFANTISLPIMIMQTLCEEDIVNADYENDANKCNDAVAGMIFLYGAGFHAMYWTNAAHRLRSVSPSVSGSQPSVMSMAFVWQVVMTPSIIGVILGLIVGLIGPFRYYLFESSSSFHALGSAIKTLGQPVVAIQSLVMAASLGHVNLKASASPPLESASSSSLSSSPPPMKEVHTRLESNDARRRGVEMIAVQTRKNGISDTVYGPLSQNDNGMSSHGISLSLYDASEHNDKSGGCGDNGGCDDSSEPDTVRNSAVKESDVEAGCNISTRPTEDVAPSALESHVRIEEVVNDVLPSGRMIFSLILCKYVT
jgi:predicted permease